MSIQVELDELGNALRVYRSAYLITVGEQGRVHVVAVSPVLDGAALTVGGLGGRSLANVAINPAVTLLWPPLEPDGHSLIVDGAAAAEGGSTIRVAVGRAVLHRPAPHPNGPSGTGCASDCAEIPVPR